MKKYIIVPLVLILFVSSATAAASYPLYNLTVSFDLERNLLKGTAVIRQPEDRDITISLGGLKVLSAKVNDRPVAPDAGTHLLELRGKGQAEIEYEVTFGDAREDGSVENAGVASSNLVGSKGISLTRMWYPSVSGLAMYHLDALMPDGFTGVSEAEDVTVESSPKGRLFTFAFHEPLNEITLAAGRYTELKESLDGTTVHAYFFPEDAYLGKTYIDHAMKYMKMYS
ncbi:MAG TPA: hypothetical protein VK435_04540, partial [Thermodesulfovibrionales bacterium]|nr:hypothetical protein [Thermodesulfovibrionales bacterium]